MTQQIPTIKLTLPNPPCCMLHLICSFLLCSSRLECSQKPISSCSVKVWLIALLWYKLLESLANLLFAVKTCTFVHHQLQLDCFALCKASVEKV